MARESIRLRSREGHDVEASAEGVKRYSSGARVGRALALAGGGITLGAASIMVPGVHLISTWLIPLLAIGIALYVYRIRARVGRITGRCPHCEADMDIGAVGAVADEAVWLRCDKCTHPLELHLS